MKAFILPACLCCLLQAAYAQTSVYDMKTFRTAIDSCETDLRAPAPPLIGLSVSLLDNASSLSASYIDAVIRAGGAPVLIPVITDMDALRQITDNLDGLIVTGGKDVNPLWYNEDPLRQLGAVDPLRDEYEIRLIKLAADRNIPLLGICRGEQLINVVFGGTLYQDIPSQHTARPVIKHVQQMPGAYASHNINVIRGSFLASVIGDGRKEVNTFHHQAVKDIAPGFRVSAYSPDSIVEAIEAWPERPIMGVQWHPEALSANDTTMLKLFTFMVGKADTFRMAKEIHKRILSVDTHTDTPLWFVRPGFDISHRERNRVNLPMMREGKLDGVFL
ncbi:MAG: gamma-glutamyl-gamma-aminobutyrate hydrolase family protein, partial [Tannerellaceae bacterium]|nr:gamma-glutamyl-gamma-aminobutyrate hydrolase family protein [Tannerellaceae bacterium]